jgi:hypothetical protein
MTRYLTALAACTVLLAVVISCSLAEKGIEKGIDKIATGDDMGRATSLWPDVPKMDGLEPSNLEPPLPIKLAFKFILNNLYRLNKEGEDKTPVKGDWIIFSTNASANDIKAFYSADKMSQFGNWKVNDKEGGCLSDLEGMQSIGAVCLYTKKESGENIMLAIISFTDDQTKNNNICFLRLAAPEEKSISNQGK